MKHILLSSALAGVLALMAAAPVSAQTLKIGAATAQTGGLASYDVPAVDGMKVAINQINAAGGIMGKIKIELIEKDVRSDAAQTSIAVQELVDAGVSVIVLPCDADPALAAAGIVDEAKIPAISTCASSPTLPLVGGKYVFTNFPGDNVQATVSASWAYKQGLRKAFILYSPDTQYTMMPLYFADVMKKLGGTVLGEATYTIGQPDFSSIATKIAALSPKPDVIMTSAYEPDFPSFIKALRAAGVTAQVIGSDGIDTPTTFSLGAVAEGIVFSTAGFATPGSPLAAFNALFKEKTGKAPETIYNAVGYDLIKVIQAAVIATGGSVDPVALRNAIANLVDVQGATSLITYKGTTGMPIRQVSLVRVKNAKRELVGQYMPDPSLIPAPRMQ